MKKVILFFIASLSILSCSSDDDVSVESNAEQALYLITEKTSVFVNDSILFTVKNADAETIEADIYVDGIKASNPFVFDKAGVFKVTAKKQGISDSNTIEITVGTKGLVLGVNQTDFYLNSRVVFSVQWLKEDVLDEVKIYNVATNEVVEDGILITSEVGEFSFIAKGENFTDSNIVTINVQERDTKNKFIINDKEHNITGVSVSVERMEVLDITSGEMIEIDKIFDIGNGVYANQYNFLFKSFKDASLERVLFTYLVPNNTIKVENGEVVDLGQRVFPTGVENIFYYETWVVVNDYQFYITFEESDSTINVDSLEVENMGIGAGSRGIDATASMQITYDGPQVGIVVDYTGKINFSEIPEEKYEDEAYAAKANAIKAHGKSVKADVIQRINL